MFGVVIWLHRRAPQLHHSFGAADGAEQPHIVAPLWFLCDRLVVTPPGETPPPIGTEIDEEDPDGRCVSAANWDQPGSTFTFTLTSFQLDLPSWSMVNWGGPDVDLKRFWGKRGIRCVLYESPGEDSVGRHLACENQYLFGVQVQRAQ